MKNLATELIALFTARRTRLMNNEAVYSNERDYARALEAKHQAEALLTVIEDVHRLHLQIESMNMSEARTNPKPAPEPHNDRPLNFYPSSRHVG
jgi:hypothetical protein